MSAADRETEWEAEQAESYYVSITDMLIGLLFLFVIMLMYFALQLRITTQELVTADDTRNRLLNELADYLHERNVRAEVDLSAGVLRLPDEILFERGQDAPKPEGVTALRVLAEGMTQKLPCYSYRGAGPRPEACPATPHHLEAVFIEGHTDSDPISSTGRLRDNWDLSSARAANTFRILTQHQPELAAFRNKEDAAATGATSLLSIAGYADQRPVNAADTREAKAANRRIDIRFVMAGPDTAAAAAEQAAPAAAPAPAPSPSASPAAPAPQ